MSESEAMKEQMTLAPKEEKPKEMVVKEGVTYTIGEFECPVCKTHHTIHCNPKGRTRKHWIE